MSLRKKVFLYILVTILFLILLMSLTSQYLAMKAFEDVERRFFRAGHGPRAQQAGRRAPPRRQICLRLGAWDSMYFFLEKKDPPGSGKCWIP